MSPEEVKGVEELHVPYVSPEIKEELAKRTAEFEQLYESKIFSRTDAAVPRIKPVDYVIAAITGVVLTIYLFVALVVG